MNRVAPSAQAQGMAARADPFRVPYTLHRSLATFGPAKVVGLVNRCWWNAVWPTDFGGPAVVGEATDATVTGTAPGINPPPVIERLRRRTRNNLITMK